ncbi:MAG: nuclear transport factor 2 family protein [Paracoccaceae bacterium]|jgi:ketosteroid isomerase-like protein|nr:nuclear transport factor 2 family protein [Paracoccaceae bacterium]
MTDIEAITLAETWFAALDAFDAQALAETLTKDCVLSIETHGARAEGRAAIVELFATRWAGGGPRARHHTFTHTPAPAHGRIASQFTVTYSQGGEVTDEKSNANVFTIRDGRIAAIQVYMAGGNTIQT